jgi:murein DD-endopeptidase MepM/ murein hydrolase activator NlpD
MKIHIFQNTYTSYKIFIRTFWDFCKFLSRYIQKKVLAASVSFEKSKNKLVKLFLIKRGRYNRPFLHFAAMLVLFIGVLVGPFLADTYPIFASNTSQVLGTQSQVQAQSIDVGNDVFETKDSKKPRDKIITYTVQKGDTLITIAKKFEISTDTIRWVNDMTSDSLSIGDQLKILPVTGIAYKVEEGDSIYTIAKKYDTEPQKIVDFPFNDFANPETFSLVIGQMLIVPDGIKPSEQQNYIRPQTYIAQGPVTITNAGFTWPLRGGISQFASWYHMALDITSPIGTPIVAAQDGTVTKVSLGTWDYGYGNNVYIASANGMSSHYAHMSSANVSDGEQVTAGKTIIGWVGMTGRTTGPHLHFEVLQNGSLINPMSVLQ